MPALADPRRESFAQLVAAGKEYKEAYIASGYKPGGAAQSGARLNRDVKVNARIVELRSLAQQIPTASMWLNENFVLNGLKDTYHAAFADKKYGDAIGALNLMGKKLNMFQDRKEGALYPDDINSLDDRQRTTVMRWLARLAYPDDPAAAEAALQIPSGSEVIEAKVEVHETKAEEEASQETSEEVFGGAGDELSGGEGVHVDDVRVAEEANRIAHSWADIEPEERSQLFLEWSRRGPAMPSNLNKEERVAWLDLNWPLESGW